MKPFEKRVWFFLIGCLGARTALTVVASQINTDYLWILGVLAVLFVLAWIRIIFFVPRTTGPEVFGGRIWWQKHRILHATLYAIFATLAFAGERTAWVPLAFDTTLAFLFFINHHGFKNVVEAVVPI